MFSQQGVNKKEVYEGGELVGVIVGVTVGVIVGVTDGVLLGAIHSFSAIQSSQLS